VWAQQRFVEFRAKAKRERERKCGESICFECALLLVTLASSPSPQRGSQVLEDAPKRDLRLTAEGEGRREQKKSKEKACQLESQKKRKDTIK